ncbi:hypothetical protein PTD2_01821 [Pseudoalteromonas tunicata D2]|uniref:Uncharacterized protein n=1 Tax=Pseudoalteromonas tunicata D2 TaxID=87626 RepID=A4C3Y5_9GAMM|nr:hypothetical protein PTD2_01821 [Pseudoalteromonas tunicata D2]
MLDTNLSLNYWFLIGVKKHNKKPYTS